MYLDLPQTLIDEVLQKKATNLGVTDIAELLCVCESTIRKEIRGGRLKATIIGRRWQISVENLLYYLEKVSNLSDLEDE
jgi:excisionase family DNA binding protein